MQLDPPELGLSIVKVKLQQDQAGVSFVVKNPSVRDALDQSSARLREMFEGEGMDLVDVDVSSQSESDEDEEAMDEHTASLNDLEEEAGKLVFVEEPSGIDHFV